MTSRIVYPGTFDPITSGHEDLVRRAARIFDEVIVGIAYSKRKQPLFTIGERIALAETVLHDLPNVKVIGFNNLLIDFLQAQNATLILRGLRAVSDFEFEFQMACMNRHLDPTIESIFLTPAEKYMFISATIVKEMAFFKADVSKFVHPVVTQALIEKYQD